MRPSQRSTNSTNLNHPIIIYSVNSKCYRKTIRKVLEFLNPKVISSSPAYETKCFSYQMLNIVRLTGSCKNL